MNRPAYHYAPRANWLSDPNGLVHHAGEWHLFYQYNPHGEDWGHMAWGHAVSPDLAAWEELPPALVEDERFMIFSGSAVIDADDTAGFGAGAMIACYTGAAKAHQAQCLAISHDRGRTWAKHPGNPVLDIGLADFRDPNLFWHAASGRWIMVVALSEENRARLYASADLQVWDELSDIPASGAPGHLWECPLLIELPIDGTAETRWLFKVDVLRGAPGSGTLYQTGQFDGARFIPDPAGWQVADHGNDFYAAIAWHAPRDAAGRPCWIGWMGNHAYQARLAPQGWRGAMSLPRRLSLAWHGERLVLRQQVEPAAVAQVPASALDAADVPLAARLTVPANAGGTVVLTDRAGARLQIERTASAITVTRHDPAQPFLDGSWQMAAPRAAEFDLWLDAGSLEVLDTAGIAALTVQHRLTGPRLALRWSADVR